LEKGVGVMDAEHIYKICRDIFGMLLFLWPFGGYLSIFLLDDPFVGPIFDFIRHYVVFSALFYPLFFFVAWLASNKALLAGISSKKVICLSLIPLLSGLPWFVIYLVILFLIDLVR
jgi:hypothetical protein